MTGIIKITLLAVILTALFVSAFVYMSGSNLYNDPSSRGTFVFENFEEDDPWIFI